MSHYEHSSFRLRSGDVENQRQDFYESDEFRQLEEDSDLSTLSDNEPETQVSGGEEIQFQDGNESDEFWQFREDSDLSSLSDDEPEPQASGGEEEDLIDPPLLPPQNTDEQLASMAAGLITSLHTVAPLGGSPQVTQVAQAPPQPSAPLSNAEYLRRSYVTFSKRPRAPSEKTSRKTTNVDKPQTAGSNAPLAPQPAPKDNTGVVTMTDNSSEASTAQATMTNAAKAAAAKQLVDPGMLPIDYSDIYSYK